MLSCHISVNSVFLYVCFCDCWNIVCLTTPRLQSPPLSSISPSSVPPHPPTGSASFSVFPMVAPQLLCKLSWVTWINDNSRGSTDQAHPLHIPGRSAADLCSFWHLMHSTVQHLPQLTFFTLLLFPSAFAAAPNIWRSGYAAIWQVSQVFNHNLCSGSCIFKHTTWLVEHCSKERDSLIGWWALEHLSQLSPKLISKTSTISHKDSDTILQLQTGRFNFATN